MDLQALKVSVVVTVVCSQIFDSFDSFLKMQNLIFTDELFLTGGWEDFPNQSMGVTEIEGVVEKDELRITDVSCMYWYKKIPKYVY